MGTYKNLKLVNLVGKNLKRKMLDNRYKSGISNFYYHEHLDRIKLTCKNVDRKKLNCINLQFLEPSRIKNLYKNSFLYYIKINKRHYKFYNNEYILVIKIFKNPDF